MKQGILIALFTVAMGCHAAQTQDVDKNKPFLPPPYIFRLDAVNDADRLKLAMVPGVKEVSSEQGRTKIVWQPFNGEPISTKDYWLKDAQQIYDFLVVKQSSGKVRWSHGGLSGGWSMRVTENLGSVAFHYLFTDRSTMTLQCYNLAHPGQVEHEMLHDVHGDKVSVQDCGGGYALFCGEEGNQFVVWQVSDQMAVRIDNCTSKDLVSDYVKKIGSITPKDFRVDTNKWIENEIYWRIQLLDRALAREIAQNDAFVWFRVGSTFPDVFEKFGKLSRKSSHVEAWEFLYHYRRFLWANRRNFKSSNRSFILNGHDLYDKNVPVELPKELSDPPKPDQQ